MDEDTLIDLKQFITATISQQLASQNQELDVKFNNLENKLSKKIDSLSDQVAQSLDQSNDTTDEQLRNHDTRITLLEQKAA